MGDRHGWSGRRWSAVAFSVVVVLSAACDGNDERAVASSTTTTAPAGEATAPLQFRPVLSSEGEDCASPEVNPPEDRPVSLAGRDGTCYDLGPAFLGVARAEAAIDSELEERPVVTVQLGDSDTAVFIRSMPDHLDETVAIVMFGRVQSAPVLRVAPTEGLIAISGLDSRTAADIVDALAG